MSTLHHVHRLALGDTLFDVNEDNFLRELLECDDIRYGCADVTCTNNSYLHSISSLKTLLSPIPSNK